MTSREVRQVALLPIRPRYAHLIIEGIKKVEFRKVCFRLEPTHVVVYASSPTQRILGHFTVAGIEQASPDELWENYGGVGGVGYEDFADYYSACPLGIAIRVGDVHPLDEPVPLTAIWGGAVPQSFAYIPPELLDRLSA